MLKWKDYYDLMNVYMIIAGIFAEKNMKHSRRLQYASWCLNEVGIIKDRTFYNKKLQMHLEGIHGQLCAALEDDNLPLVRAALQPIFLILDMYEPQVVVL